MSIPVEMYLASREREFKFVLMHDSDFSPIRYARICKEEEKEVFSRSGYDIPISSTETTLPRIILGAAFNKGLNKNLDLLAEIDLNVSTNGTKAGVLAGKNFSVDPSLGLELGYVSKVFLRLGVGNLQRTLNDVNSDKRSLDFQPNVGLGVKLGRLRIDYALANVGNLSGALASHIFSLNLDLAERKSQQ